MASAVLSRAQLQRSLRDCAANGDFALKTGGGHVEAFLEAAAKLTEGQVFKLLVSVCGRGPAAECRKHCATHALWPDLTTKQQPNANVRRTTNQTRCLNRKRVLAKLAILWTTCEFFLSFYVLFVIFSSTNVLNFFFKKKKKVGEQEEMREKQKQQNAEPREITTYRFVVNELAKSTPYMDPESMQ